MTTRPMLLALMAAAAGLGCVVVTGDTDLPETAILARADDWSTKVTSGHFAFRTESTLLDDPRSDFVAEAEIWFDAGRSRLDQKVERPHAQRAEIQCEERVRIFDGTNVIEGSPEHPDRMTVLEVEDLAELPRYTSIGHASRLFGDLIGPAFNHGLPLGDGIAAWGGRLVGKEELAGLECFHFEAPPRAVPKDATIVHHWWLAPAKGCALVQASEEITWAPSHGPALRRNVTTVEEWEEGPEGIWAPKVGKHQVFITARGGAEELKRVDRTELTLAEFNISIPSETFRLEPPLQSQGEPSG